MDCYGRYKTIADFNMTNNILNDTNENEYIIISESKEYLPYVSVFLFAEKTHKRKYSVWLTSQDKKLRKIHIKLRKIKLCMIANTKKKPVIKVDEVRI